MFQNDTNVLLTKELMTVFSFVFAWALYTT